MAIVSYGWKKVKMVHCHDVPPLLYKQLWTNITCGYKDYRGIHIQWKTSLSSINPCQYAKYTIQIIPVLFLISLLSSSSAAAVVVDAWRWGWHIWPSSASQLLAQSVAGKGGWTHRTHLPPASNPGNQVRQYLLSESITNWKRTAHTIHQSLMSKVSWHDNSQECHKAVLINLHLSIIVNCELL